MVVHYRRTVWKNSYAEHEVTCKTLKKIKLVCKGLRGIKTLSKPMLDFMISQKKTILAMIFECYID